MSTSHSTVDYLLSQIQDAGSVSARKMFGEYVLYWNGRVAALVCDSEWLTELIRRTAEAVPLPKKKVKMK